MVSWVYCGDDCFGVMRRNGIAIPLLYFLDGGLLSGSGYYSTMYPDERMNLLVSFVADCYPCFLEGILIFIPIDAC